MHRYMCRIGPWQEAEIVATEASALRISGTQAHHFIKRGEGRRYAAARLHGIAAINIEHTHAHAARLWGGVHKAEYAVKSVFSNNGGQCVVLLSFYERRLWLSWHHLVAVHGVCYPHQGAVL